MTPVLNGEFFRADDHLYQSDIANAEKIQMLTGCVMPLTQGNQMRAAVRVLNRAGKDVEIPSSQVCCGAINSHVGDLEKAKELARENIEAFSKGDKDEPIVVASAGCGTRMKEYAPLLADDPEYSSRAASFSKRVVDINEYLNGIQLLPGEFSIPRVVTYQDSCHLANVQKVRDAPRNLLKSIQGVDFCELKGSNICCGAGGTYMITEPEMSKAILANKMEDIIDSGADTIATANPGCFMQLENGIREAGLDVEVKYVTDLLDEAYTKK
ncbi:MAG TPA: (Fe-S)-binding protein [Dehalococcoidia bacterium]|nr:(Fe-S)-binding protein [Dehalococcoidia bacterium]